MTPPRATARRRCRFWPDGIYTAPTEQALVYDIAATRALGFNTIRKHVKVEPQRCAGARSLLEGGAEVKAAEAEAEAGRAENGTEAQGPA